jgi:hypothetical protein
MRKKTLIKAKPTKPRPADADAWVAGGSQPEPVEPAEEKPAKLETKRFTIDIPVTLHKSIKSKCALKGVKMREEILALLEKHFGD